VVALLVALSGVQDPPRAGGAFRVPDGL